MTSLGHALKTSDLFVKALENEGVKYIFAVPGEENLDLVESLRTSSIKLIVVRHEQAGGFMAATVGRLTGCAGVALSTLGPGATNFTTAAAYSHLGAFPAIFITGQKPILKSKQGAFQIVDTVNLFQRISKFSKQLPDGGMASAYVREAFRIAEEERPGAAHIELPEDIAGQMVKQEEAVIYHRDKVRRPVPEDKAISRAVDMIRSARHPLIVIGAGANRKMTSNMLRQFVDAVGMPFCDTQQGKGVIDSRHPMYMGTAAISSSDYVHACIDHADLILMVGHDVVEKPPFFMVPSSSSHKGTKVVHINYFSAQVDSVYFPSHACIGDIGNAIWQLKEALKKEPPNFDTRYYCYVKRQMEANFAQGASDASLPMSPPRLISVIRAAMPEDGITCLDNGLYKVWFARQFPVYHPNTLLLDNALATMGAGLPSAMAAKLVHPECAVLAVVGDGGFMMNSQELATAVRLKLHIVVLILNDNCYGMIKWKQEGMEFAEYGLSLNNPDFVKYAEAYGAHGHRITQELQFQEVLVSCLDEPGVHIIELPIDYASSAQLQVPALQKHLQETLRTPEDFLKDQSEGQGISGRGSVPKGRSLREVEMEKPAVEEEDD